MCQTVFCVSYMSKDCSHEVWWIMTHTLFLNCMYPRKHAQRREFVWMKICLCRMDPDHHQIPVGAASEGGWVLQTVPQPGLCLPTACHTRGGGDSHEAMGVQREASHVHVSGEFFPVWSKSLELIIDYIYLKCKSTCMSAALVAFCRFGCDGEEALA